MPLHASNNFNIAKTNQETNKTTKKKQSEQALKSNIHTIFSQQESFKGEHSPTLCDLRKEEGT